MQLTWMTNRRRYIGTQTEARQLKEPFEVRDVPISKPELIAHLNGVEEAHEAELAAAAGVTGTAAEVEPEVAPAPEAAIARPVQAPAAPGQRTVVEQILDMEPAQLAPVLSAAIGRLGEVAGTHGWAAFGKDVYAWTAGARSVEQGLGMLMLAAMDSLRAAHAETPVRPITPE